MKTILKMGLILCVLFCLSPFVSAQFIESPFIAWSPDGSMIAVAKYSQIEILDATNQTLLGTLTGNMKSLYEVEWTSDSAKLASASLDSLAVWDVATGQIIATRQKRTISVSWNPDNVRIASASASGSIAIWDMSSGQITLPQLFGSEVEWSPDGNKLASAKYDEAPINVTDIPTSQSLFTLPGHANGVGDVEWSPDGTKIASGGADNMVRVWNAMTGESLFALTGHTDVVTSVAWNSNNTTLASGSSDGTIRFWDTQNGQSLNIIQAGGQVRSIAWSPDGTKLAYGNPDGTITIIPAPTSAATPAPTSAGYFIPPCPRICGTATATPGQ